MGTDGPFSGDSYLGKEFEKLVKNFKIKNIIETGTFLGETSREFSKMVENVYTIESNEKFYQQARKNLLNCPNVKIFLGNSPVVLDKILPTLKGNTLFFLDAHWEKYWPILDELKIIAKFPNMKNSVIVIHDFYVPGTNLGFDSYYHGSKSNLELFLKKVIGVLGRLLKMNLIERQRLDYEFIEKSIKEINPSLKHYYNSMAEGTRRGIIFIHP